MRRPRWPAVLAVTFALGAGGVGYGWSTFSGYYAFLPDPAKPAAAVVKAKGGEPPKPGSGFYFVDVSVLRANEIQKLWAEHLVDGAQVVPADELLSPGESEKERIAVNNRMMTDSKTTARTVAERALGYHVPIDRRGAQVLTVQSGMPAAKAGVKPGAIITSVDGKPVRSTSELIDAMASHHPGDTVRLGFRDGSSRSITTVASPDDRSKAIFGIEVGDAVKVGRAPIPVTISTPGIGGPSAGLAFALEIYDSLSHRQLLHGHEVVATGELDLDGGVHAIGGVDQKTVGAIDVGADTFIVPQGNLSEARRAAHGRIRVIGVSTFSQAVAAIRALPGG